MPRLDSPKAEAPPQAVNELRTDELNEQSPPPVTPVTPDSATSLYPFVKASSIAVFRQCLEDDLTSAEEHRRLNRYDRRPRRNAIEDRRWRQGITYYLA
jgi:hypothetical protein